MRSECSVALRVPLVRGRRDECIKRPICLIIRRAAHGSCLRRGAGRGKKCAPIARTQRVEAMKRVTRFVSRSSVPRPRGVHKSRARFPAADPREPAERHPDRRDGRLAGKLGANSARGTRRKARLHASPDVSSVTPAEHGPNLVREQPLISHAGLLRSRAGSEHGEKKWGSLATGNIHRAAAEKKCSYLPLGCRRNCC